MAMTSDDIRRHPAYKYGFENHRKYLELGRPVGRQDLVRSGEWGNQLTFFPGENFGPYDIWLMGAHAGMKNRQEFYDRPGKGIWKTNPEPIYNDEPGNAQLELF